MRRERTPAQLYRKVPFYRAVIGMALIAVLWSVATGRAAADGAQSVTVPLIQHGVHVYVQATVNGRRALFVLDTGAGANFLTPRAARRMALAQETGKVNVEGAGGDAASASAVTIEKLGIGEAVLTDQSAYVVPLPDALMCDGLLGTPFFQAWIVQFERT